MDGFSRGVGGRYGGDSFAHARCPLLSSSKILVVVSMR